MCPNSFDAGMSTTPERSEAFAVDIHSTVDQMSVRLSEPASLRPWAVLPPSNDWGRDDFAKR